jgi:hypothetical protein
MASMKKRFSCQGNETEKSRAVKLYARQIIIDEVIS